jgi:hypothetical protein
MKRIAAAILLLCMAIACAKGPDGDPSQVVELYLQAKIERDAESIQRLLCSEMEIYYQRELHTFETVTGVTIQDMNCQRRDQSDVIQCQGKIIAVYGGEQRNFPLGSYRVVQEDGEWKWCGEAK